jgi:hypothetical protein
VKLNAHQKIPRIVAELRKRYHFISDQTVIGELALIIATKVRENARVTETEVHGILFSCDLTQDQVRTVIRDLTSFGQPEPIDVQTSDIVGG